MTGPPSARGARLEWSDLPPAVVAAVEGLLEARVTAATTQPHGFSPGVAVRVRLEDGRCAFVKAVGADPNPTSPAFHRREAAVVRTLPPAAPVPRFLGDAEVDGWVVLAFADVEGRHPQEPWRRDELDRVLDAVHELTTTLTPSPVDAPAVGESLIAINSWHRLRSDTPRDLDALSMRRLDELVDLESRVHAVEGETLLHFDLRADNILLTDDRVWFVDWPHAQVGPPWVDAVAFAPSVAMQGGPRPEEVLARWPGAKAADRELVDAVIASVAGFFTYRALQPPQPGLPTLRAFQAAQGDVARAWIAERRGWA